MPSVMLLRFALCAASIVVRGRGITVAPRRAPDSVRAAERRFIAGDPMNPATNALTGRA